MKSALEMIKAELKLCDIIIYMLDARCPQSCINPKYEEFLYRKPVLFVLNKSDLAPNSQVSIFASKIKQTSEPLDKGKDSPSWEGVAVRRTDGVGSPHIITLNSTQSGTGQKVINAINEVLKEKIAASAQKGIKRTIRAIVIGVTNCGKSTFINNLAARGKAMTGDRPGVTRTKQWVPVNQHLWLLDTPGTLWPKFDNPQVAKNLAYVGSIKDDIMDTISLSKDLMTDLIRLDPDCIKNRFGADEFEEICRKRGYILKGGILDEERAAKAILVEYRAGKLGRFNLDELL